MNKYFRLNPECYLILGKKKSIIHNILTTEMIWLDEENTKNLLKAEVNAILREDEEFYNELVDLGYGFFSDNLIYIDKFRIINNFNQNKLWIDTQSINFASIQVTNTCNLNCNFCSKVFCPSCKVFESMDESISLEKWKNIIDELRFFGVKNILFTGGETSTYENIDELVNYSIDKGIKANIHTNGIKKLNNISNETTIIITLFNREYLNKIINNYKNNDNVVLLVQEKDLNFVKSKVHNFKVVKTFNFNEPRLLTKNNLSKVGVNEFFSKKISNHCLNGKISISYNGDVYPCFGSKTPLINLKEDNLSKAMKILIEKYWKKPLDKMDKIMKCVECEFRYTCNTCIFTRTDQLCTYNLEEGIWL